MEGSDAVCVKVSAGPWKAALRWPSTATVAEVKDDLEKEIGVPAAEQKIIHRGKALTDLSASLSECGVRDHDKMMVIRVKPDFELDPMYQEVVQLSVQTTPLLKKFGEVEKEFAGMQAGFLDLKLQLQALPKLSQRLAVISEGFMRLLEKLDTFRFSDDQKEAKLKRRDVVVTIQNHMDKVDTLLKLVNDRLKTVGASRNKN